MMRTAALLTCLIVLGCDSKPSNDAPAPTTSATAAAGPSGPGVYFVLENRGVVALQDGKFRQLGEAEEEAKDSRRSKAPSLEA